MYFNFANGCIFLPKGIDKRNPGGVKFNPYTSQGVKQDAFWGDQYKVGQKMRIYCRGIKMDPEQYEMVVKELIQSKLREDCPQANLTVIHNAKCHGKSGHEHQIDVLVELVIAGVRLKIPVECKRYSRNVGIDDIMEFASRIDDISAHKGILVSTIGFERGAVRFAASKGIALVLVCNYSWQVIMEHRLPVSQKESEQIKKDFMLKRRRTFEKILKEIFSDKSIEEFFPQAVQQLTECEVNLRNQYNTLSKPSKAKSEYPYNQIAFGFVIQSDDVLGSIYRTAHVPIHDTIWLDASGLLSFFAIGLAK